MLPESESQEGAEGGLEMEVETGEVDALVSDLFTCAEERPSLVKPPIKVDVSINGQSVQMELDTGAAVSVCTYRRFKELWPDGDRLLQPSSRLLRTFSGEKLSVRGDAFTADAFTADSHAASATASGMSGTGEAFVSLPSGAAGSWVGGTG
ncbi:hypothetical protein FJT64_027233 [Amphibalanus amphitrite]|uniref:Peptidase A2 domain-containing protein n=1 Tax=Amphibalanus amphitrite TaxID=1232801 RepID=A0A6A4WE40_AMPAM|nr:hypothetical protein FJT64_027233 [Amphibalanus amphitrite]